MELRTKITTGLIVMILAVASPVSAGLFGAPKFTMSQSDDRFSADGRTTWSSKGNRISTRSIAGGRHIDSSGVFVNPAVVIDRNTGKVAQLSLVLLNLAERMSGIGAPNSFGRPERISIITGEGAPIVLPVIDGEQNYGETSCSLYQIGCTTSLVETGIAPIRPDQYRRLISATVLAIKIEGSERSHVYETKDIDRSFIPNLAAFFEQHVAPGL